MSPCHQTKINSIWQIPSDDTTTTLTNGISKSVRHYLPYSSLWSGCQLKFFLKKKIRELSEVWIRPLAQAPVLQSKEKAAIRGFFLWRFFADLPFLILLIFFFTEKYFHVKGPIHTTLLNGVFYLMLTHLANYLLEFHVSFRKVCMWIEIMKTSEIKNSFPCPLYA